MTAQAQKHLILIVVITCIASSCALISRQIPSLFIYYVHYLEISVIYDTILCDMVDHMVDHIWIVHNLWRILMHRGLLYPASA